MNACLAGAAVLTALTGLLGGASLLRRRGSLTAEAARKAVHVGMGIVCAAFPWLFSGPQPVLILAGMAIVALLAVRGLPAVRGVLGCALHDVSRRSYGELAYVVGIATLFVFAAGDVLVYVIPVAVLTLADPAASFVGMRCARYRFTTRDGSKSIAGSLAFFVMSAMCITAILLVASVPYAHTAGVPYVPVAGFPELLLAGPLNVLVVARLDALITGGPAASLGSALATNIGGGADRIIAILGASAVLMLVEASAWSGFDNFTIPFAGGILMRSVDGTLLGGMR